MSSHATERTLICTVMFADLVAHTRRTVPEQKGFKECFTAVVGEAVRRVPEGERVIIDSGDGAAIVFRADPENALFAALHLRAAFKDAIRVGINLGPVQLVKDVNGATGVIGDGINAANRVLGFATPGQVVASRSYRDAISFLAPEYRRLFSFGGIHLDKHRREHEVYVAGELPEAYERARASLDARAAAPVTSNRTIRAIIAEDEPILRDELVKLLGSVWPELEIAAVASDGLSAMRAFDAEKPDVVFLDIQMPGMTGIEVARSVGERAHIVFLTANNTFALSAFDEGAVDYVLKPYTAARLYTACRRLRQRLGA